MSAVLGWTSKDELLPVDKHDIKVCLELGSIYAFLNQSIHLFGLRDSPVLYS